MFEKKIFLRRALCCAASAVCAIAPLRVAPEAELFAAAEGSGLTAFEITEDIKIGWNLGNTLDAYGGGSGNGTETCWGNPTTSKAMIDAVKAKGFNAVRVPTTWYAHLDGDNNIDSAWMARVKEVVNYAISNDMYVILNMHHEEWVDRADLGTAYDQMKPKFVKIWTQINDAFKDYDQHLIFESLNEPRAKGTTHEWENPQQDEMETINKLNADFVEVVRSSDSPYAKNRLLMIPGYAASADPSIYKNITVPDDDFVAISIHAYTPYDFTMNPKISDHSTFTESYSENLSQNLAAINETFIKKDIPVIIGEFGTSNFDNTEARVKWATQYMTETKTYGIPCFLWDNNIIQGGNSPGERHGYLDRNSCSWYSQSEPVVNAMMSVMNDDDIPWGGGGGGSKVKYEHDDIRYGMDLRIKSQNVDAAANGGKTEAAAITWPTLEYSDVAVKFAGDAPYLVFADTTGDNSVKIEPYDVADGIAYYSYKDVKEAWKARETIASVCVGTTGATGVDKVALIRATGEFGRPIDEWYRFGVDLSGAAKDDTLVLEFKRDPSAAGQTFGVQFWYIVGTEEVSKEYQLTADENGRYSVRLPISDIPALPTQAGAVSMDCAEVQFKYYLEKSSSGSGVAGDADGDGEVKMNDAVLILQSISNPDTYGVGKPNGLTEAGAKNADVIGGDGVTPLDAATIQKYLLHLVSELPVK